ncbi:hypothetical protein ACFL1B_02900 [Nanoarchaeota archaeon]
MQKKGFELSINFTVVILLSIIIIGLGLTMFTKMFTKIDAYSDTVDANTEQWLLDMLRTGEPLQVPIIQATVERGEREKFYVAVKSDLAEQKLFKLFIEPDPQARPFFDVGATVQYNVRYNQNPPIALPPAGYHIWPIMIEVPGDALPEMSYTFTGMVCRNKISLEMPPNPAPLADCDLRAGSAAFTQKYHDAFKLYVHVP